MCFLYSKWSQSLGLFIIIYDNSEFDTFNFQNWQQQLQGAEHTRGESSNARLTTENEYDDEGGENPEDGDDEDEEDEGDEEEEEDETEEEGDGDEGEGDQEEEEEDGPEMNPMDRISDSEGNEDYYFSNSNEPGTYEIFDNIGTQDTMDVEENARRTGFWDGDLKSIGAGTKFRDKAEAQDAIKRWSLKRAADYKTVRSDPRTWAVHCITRDPSYPRHLRHGIKCAWSIRVSLQPHLMAWQVVKWVDRHNCAGEVRDNTSRIITANDVADLIYEKIRAKPGYEIQSIQIDCHAAFECKVGYDKCWEGRRKALERRFGSTK